VEGEAKEGKEGAGISQPSFKRSRAQPRPAFPSLQQAAARDRDDKGARRNGRTRREPTESSLRRHMLGWQCRSSPGPAAGAYRRCQEPCSR
jgi:hypothetical protein